MEIKRAHVEEKAPRIPCVLKCIFQLLLDMTYIEELRVVKRRRVAEILCVSIAYFQ